MPPFRVDAAMTPQNTPEKKKKSVFVNALDGNLRVHSIGTSAAGKLKNCRRKSYKTSSEDLKTSK